MTGASRPNHDIELPYRTLEDLARSFDSVDRLDFTAGIACDRATQNILNIPEDVYIGLCGFRAEQHAQVLESREFKSFHVKCQVVTGPRPACPSGEPHVFVVAVEPLLNINEVVENTNERNRFTGAIHVQNGCMKILWGLKGGDQREQVGAGSYIRISLGERLDTGLDYLLVRLPKRQDAIDDLCCRVRMPHGVDEITAGWEIHCDPFGKAMCIRFDHAFRIRHP